MDKMVEDSRQIGCMGQNGQWAGGGQTTTDDDDGEAKYSSRPCTCAFSGHDDGRRALWGEQTNVDVDDGAYLRWE